MVRRTTLRDIAQTAGVSVSTVSQALNHRPGVSANVRQNILDTAAELGYRPRSMMDSGNGGRLRTVGLITKRRNDQPLSLNPFYAPILAGAEQECQRQNIALMYSSIEVDEDSRALAWPPLLTDERVDGLIVVGAFLPETIAHIGRQIGSRLVLVDGYAGSQEPMDSIVTDNRGGARMAVEHLIAQGHRRIGLIGSHPHSYPSIRERRAGFIEAMSAHDLPLTGIEDGLLDRQEAYDATLRLLRRAPETTALFVCNDNSAVGVLNALQKLGLNCPAEVSVIGFDDIELASAITPALTTIHVDKVLMGVLAVRNLRDRLNSPERPALTMQLGTRLIARASVRALMAVDEPAVSFVPPRPAARAPRRLTAATP
jgi:DNA-binding LacI/PurR family transcriptional regulator